LERIQEVSVPKIVDHEQRRRELAEAVFRVIGTQGISAVSLRDVAAEAGVSMGLVQHYFHTKNEMLLFAMAHLHNRVLKRLDKSLGQIHNPSAREYELAIARVLLPVDPPSREEALLNLAFFAVALSDDEFASIIRDGYQKLQAAFRRRVLSAADRGELTPGLDAANESAKLFYLIQGLIGPTVIGAMPPSTALALVEHQLDRLYV
jgi:AcrR family transcriptional regulator